MKPTVVFCIFVTLVLTSCGEEQFYTSQFDTPQEFNPAEMERDYPEGFFTSDEDITHEDEEGGEHHTHLPDPEDLQNQVSAFFRFDQTTWDECNEEISGNYTGFGCARSRGISVILKRFLNEHIFQCIDEGLAAQGGGSARDLHIVHAGIVGDRRHSPRSMHAEQRAIDVKTLDIVLTSGRSKTFTYSKIGNRPFYTALRRCWGKVVTRYNDCPVYNGNLMLTGSIGWENRNHGRHMHLSVPYCINGRHGDFFWRR